MSIGLTSIDALKNYTFLAVPLFIATGIYSLRAAFHNN